MSAIAGIFHMNGEPVSPEHSQGMMKSLEKYPADDVQTWQKCNVFLGCHAQWITPESVGEKLPYYDHERKLAITADAIIDNRDELFDKLNIEKHKRKHLTDSELILLAYYKWGEDSPKHLVGDFAYMIWDERENKLFGARDFSGMRTLYYYNDGIRIIFCTAILPLFSLPFIKKQLNEQWLAEFLAIPHMIDTADYYSTIYKKVLQVPPSHSILITNNGVKFSRYSHLGNEPKLKLKSNDEYIDAFREVFQKSVDARLRTYKNVGAQLSGGLDSSSVASFAAKSLSKLNKPLHTYSYIPVEEFVDWTPNHRLADERPYIQSTVEYVGNIKENYLDFKGRNSLSEINPWLDILEMPYKFFENSYWLRGIFEKAHENNAGVLLNGARGNFTISWGPSLDYYASLLKKLRLIKYYTEFNHFVQTTRANKSRLRTVIMKKAFPSIFNKSLPQNQYQLPAIINPIFADKYDVFNKLQEQGGDLFGSIITDVYDARREHFEKVFLWSSSGTVGTKLSLGYSLWNRDPTNDLRLVRFCLSVPEDQYVNNGYGRALIRNSTKGYLPDKVRLNQHVKGIQGADTVFRMIPLWNEFLGEIQNLLSEPYMREILDINVLKESLSKIEQEGPKPEAAFDINFRILMRSLIIYRFIKNFN